MKNKNKAWNGTECSTADWKIFSEEHTGPQGEPGTSGAIGNLLPGGIEEFTCPNNQNITTIILTPVAGGGYSFSVRCRDASGNSGSNTPANEGEGFTDPTDETDKSKNPPGRSGS
jgi:hypothetical protein